MKALLLWRPSLWLRLRRWFAQSDNTLLIDNRRVAEHNANEARRIARRKHAEARQADEDVAHYERELRKVDDAMRINDGAIARDTLTLAARGAR